MPSKKDPNKPRGRMTGYAYFVQTCREEHKRKHPNEQIVFTEFSKKCAKRWKPMSEKEKKAFNDMADRDRIRYEREMKLYVPPPGSKGKASKKKKDPNAPKRPQSAFFLFCADFRGELKKANPSWSVGEIAKELGKRWADASADVKKKYADRGEIEKEKYNKEMEKYRAQQVAGRSSNSRAAERESSDESESDSD